MAVVRIDLASEPDDGSVSENDASFLPEIRSSNTAFLWASLPNLKMPSATVLWIARLIAVGASAAPVSSIARE